MTNKLLAYLIVAAAGCGAVTPPASATGDDDGSDTGSGSAMTPPDGGSGEGSDGSGSGSGSGSQGDGPGTLTGHVLDERNDTIDFSSGEPLHTHAGSATVLSAGSCADVYKYAYLMSALPPMYGHENAVNPFAWQIAGGNTNPSQTSYRVRDDANNVLLDWTAVSADAQGQYAITLYRDGANGFAALGTTDGKMHLDVRFHDLQGHEIIQQGCWVNHPLAAPLLIEQATVSDLMGMRLPTDGAISNVESTPGVMATTWQITQQTAEPIKFQLSAAPSTGTVSIMAVDTWVNIGTTTPRDGDCGTTNACQKAVVSTSSAPSTAPLAPAWSIVVLDGLNDATVCQASSLNMTCTLPGRAANQPVHGYRMRFLLGGVNALHVGGAFDLNSEWTAGTWGMYTGVAPGAIQYNCDRPRTIPHSGELVCGVASQLQHIVALDRASIAFDAIGISLVTYGSANGFPPSYMPADALSMPAWTWDAGDKGLPLEN